MEDGKKMRENVRNVLMVLFLMLSLVAVVGAAEKSAESLQGKVSIFVTSWCPYCRGLESYLRENNVTYTRYDIEKDQKGAMLYQQLGGGGVPMIQIGSRVIRGFDESELTPLLKERRSE